VTALHKSIFKSACGARYAMCKYLAGNQNVRRACLKKSCLFKKVRNQSHPNFARSCSESIIKISNFALVHLPRNFALRLIAVEYGHLDESHRVKYNNYSGSSAFLRPFDSPALHAPSSRKMATKAFFVSDEFSGGPHYILDIVL
jgi:hypothetical protein